MSNEKIIDELMVTIGYLIDVLNPNRDFYTREESRQKAIRTIERLAENRSKARISRRKTKLLNSGK